MRDKYEKIPIIMLIILAIIGLISNMVAARWVNLPWGSVPASEPSIIERNQV